MKRTIIGYSLILLLAANLSSKAQTKPAKPALKINDLEYLEMQGLNVMLAHDFYPESHQGGVGIIQNGLRVATNGDLRLEPTPGQWQPVPKVGKRVVDRQNNEISVRMEYPDASKDRKGFNPIIYPNLNMSYNLKIKPEGKSFRIIVDLDKPIPDEWVGKVGFNFELYPGILFGKSYYMNNEPGIFPRQANGPGKVDSDGEYQIEPMARGTKLTIAPETASQTMIIQNLKGNELQLIDGRARHTNGWYVVRSLVQKGATKNAIEWLITPNALPNWKYSPVIQVSQVGYHPKQQKLAVIETDVNDTRKLPVTLLRVTENGVYEKVLEVAPKNWGKFLRYNYYQLDFTKIEKQGMYVVKYADYQTEPFQINSKVFERNVWQPTLEYFLPAQMCHMRINDRYKVWHGFCHMDDATMAPTDSTLFDGYIQGSSTLTKYKSGQHVPGLNRGGWHDAGDFDMRVESLVETMHGLSLIYEMFGVKYDNTTIDQKNHVVEIHQPDGKPDILQQIEHGALSVVDGYRSLGRLYRGIIEPTKRQYTLLGDAANLTDNVVFNVQKQKGAVPEVGLPGSKDDRLVYTEENPRRELESAAGLAASYRVLKGYNDTLANQCLEAAEQLWNVTKEGNKLDRINAATELLITTKDKKYADFLVSMTPEIVKNISRVGWIVGRTLPLINDENYKNSITAAVKGYRTIIDAEEKNSPYGVPYKPDIWGAGWGIQNFGVQQYFLYASFPTIFSENYMLHAMNFVLGCHPGSNTASFASGVGSRSLTTAYGANRADFSYIPGGIGSGTALIRPDFPELLTWPFLWQQTEYVLGGGTTDYMFLVIAANNILSKK